MSFVTFIDSAITTLYVPTSAGSNIPIQMPSGVLPGDQLVVFMENEAVNPVSAVGVPSGWTGMLSTGMYWKTADGSEDGAVINWKTNDTTLFGATPQRVIVAAALCYRFSTPPFGSPFSPNVFFENVSSLGSTATLTTIPQTGVVGATQFRVMCAVGQRSDAPSDPMSTFPLTGVTWSNPLGGLVDRIGLVSEAWIGTSPLELNDSTSISVADVFYNFPPPFSVYQPNDSVTMEGGAFSTGGFLESIVFLFPGFEQVAYWGINASTPT